LDARRRQIIEEKDAIGRKRRGGLGGRGKAKERPDKRMQHDSGGRLDVYRLPRERIAA